MHPTIHNAAFSFASLSLIAAAQMFGGPPWAALCLIALVAQFWTDRRPSHLILIACSFAWLCLSKVTGRRDLFFPYTMALTSLVFLQLADSRFWSGVIGAIIALTAFFVVRIQQQTSPRVLLVEFIVAAALLEFVMVAHFWRPRRLAWRVGIAGLTSLLAYCSLSI